LHGKGALKKGVGGAAYQKHSPRGKTGGRIESCENAGNGGFQRRAQKGSVKNPGVTPWESTARSEGRRTSSQVWLAACVSKTPENESTGGGGEGGKNVY